MNDIVYKGKINNNLDILIRYPRDGDAKAMRDYINTLSKEKTYITFQGEKITLKDEEKYLKNQLERIKKKETVQLLVFVCGELSGISSIDLKKKIQNHTGIFGISISKKNRNKGLGKLLMKLVFSEASKNLPKLKIATLGVFAENQKALKMYKNFGFIEYGRLPNGIQYKGKFVDNVSMYKKI